MAAEAVHWVRPPESPFAGLSNTGAIQSKGGGGVGGVGGGGGGGRVDCGVDEKGTGPQGVATVRAGDPSRPPRMPEHRSSKEEALDSPVSGLVEATPSGLNPLQIHSMPSGILKEEGSTRVGIGRAVSWADFSHEDPARLTQVVEFERDGTSSPTSVDSWEGQETVQCSCCWIQ